MDLLLVPSHSSDGAAAVEMHREWKLLCILSILLVQNKAFRLLSESMVLRPRISG